jgi:hypothetical protein
MITQFKQYYILFVLNIFLSNVYAQINIPSGSEIYLSPTSEWTINDTLILNGTIKSSTSFGSKLNFKGKQWQTGTSGSIAGKSKIIFNGSSTQSITSSNDTSIFSVLEVNNSSNLNIYNGHILISDSMNFVNGKILLNKNDIQLSKNVPISGYNETRYFVTNGNSTDSTKGYLIIDFISNSDIAFPIGSSTSYYTPASIQNSGTTDNYKIRVFDNVLSCATSGTDNNYQSVKKTWQIEENTSGGSNLTIKLQHIDSDEGTLFLSGKANHFNSYYVGTAPNTSGDTTSNSNWANFKPTGGNAGVYTLLGMITSGSAITGSTTTTSSGMTHLGYYTKTIQSSTATPLPVELIYFQGKKIGELKSEIEWMTASELKNKGFWVQKSEDAIQFENWKWVDGQGTKNSATNYKLIDEKCQLGNNYYRFIQVDEEGIETSFKIINIRFEKGKATKDIIAYPIPVLDYLTLELKNIEEKIKIELFDNLGKLIFKGEHTDLTQIRFKLDLKELVTGVYFLRCTNSQFEKTIKLTKE